MSRAPNSPEAAPPKERSCLFYGCLTVLVLVVIFCVVIFFAVRAAVTSFVAKHTSSQPLSMPKIEMTTSERQALDAKLTGFQAITNQAAAASVPALTLNAGEINELISRHPDMKNRFFVDIGSNQITGKISLPLEELKFPIIGRWLKGRYLNGSAGLRAGVQSGVLVVNLASVEVNGVQVPPEVISGMSQENLAMGFYGNPQVSNVLTRLASVEINEGKVVVKPKVPDPPK
jgi:hypothetical protein